jgi:RND family efflux transporter MFP subunit
MKKTLIIVSLILLGMSCNNDNQAKLDKLIKQRDELNTEIENLEKEIAKTDTTSIQNEIIDASTQEIVSGIFNHYIEVQGKLDGAENVVATAQTPGIIKSVLVKEGDFVKKGQTLAFIDDGIIQESLNQLESQLVFVTDIYNRQKSLWEQKVGSEVQYLSAKNNKESLENQINTLKEQVDMYKIKSPISGSVEEISVKIGQAVSPGLPIFKVINFTSVKVVAEVSESYISSIKKGDIAILYFPDLQKEITKKLDFSSKFINPINRTFQVISQFTPEDNEYRANMIVVLKINDYHKDKAITLPINYIQTENDVKYVYTAVSENGNLTARKKIVKTGIEYAGITEILEGLNVGEKIITDNFQNIYDGIVIKK